MVDSAFLIANLTKLLEGGWIPLAVAAMVYLVMSTWRMDARCLNQGAIRTQQGTGRSVRGRRRGQADQGWRGTAVYFSSDPTAVPATLLLSPDVQMVTSEAIKQKLMPEDDDKTTYFVRSEELVLTKDKTMARWRKRFYALLNRSPQDVTSMWNVPSDQTVGLRMSTPL